MRFFAGPDALLSTNQSYAGRQVLTVPVIATFIMLVGSTVLLFARLGNYSLWTDEASTAITGAGVWRTGDTSAWLDDHNLLTYRDGLLLKGQKDRYTSPLQFYLVAPFIGLLGKTAFACRLPFALCGLGTVGLVVMWLRRWQPPNAVWIAAAVILLTSTSFFLFQRQCRYYAPATFFSALTAYLYCNWDGRRRGLLCIGIAMALLLTSQYLDYAAVVGCLLIDYGIWGRRRRKIRGLNWLILIAPQLITAAIVCPIWNPIARASDVIATASTAGASHLAPAVSHRWIDGFVGMFWWNLRDLLACDFAIVPLLAICPILYFKCKEVWLLRAPMALLVFVGMIAFFTAHPLTPQGNAEVRYLAPLLPLCIVIGIVAVWGLLPLRRWAAGVLLGLSIVSVSLSSTVSYYGELANPPTEPYTLVASWIKQNIPSGSTVYVCPDWCVSPTMWNASAPTYVWQLNDPPKPDYQKLPDIYFKGRVAPDYLVAYGPYLEEVKQWQTVLAARGIRYELAATLPVYYKEMFRPELIWRSSTTIKPAADEQVFMLRRLDKKSDVAVLSLGLQ